MTLTILEVNPAAIGRLIALFERAVGLYAFLVNINAYHQPGVEAGKQAASTVLAIRKSVIQTLKSEQGVPHTASQLSHAIEQTEKTGWVFKILENLAVNQPNQFERKSGGNPLEDLFLARQD